MWLEKVHKVHMPHMAYSEHMQRMVATIQIQCAAGTVDTADSVEKVTGWFFRSQKSFGWLF